MPDAARYLNIADFRARAARRLPRPVFAFLEGGAEDEATVARNRAAFDDYALLPRIMHDVTHVDPSVSVFGQRLAWPFVVAPTGMPGLFNSLGEIAVARAAAETGTLYTLSTMASRSIEEVAQATDAPKLFQLYIFRDRGITRELIQRARDAGYVGLMLAVDIQVPANRERDKRTGMTIPPRFGSRSLLDFALRPFWCLDQLRHPFALANFAGRRAEPGVPLLRFISEQFDPNLSWKDLEWVAAEWGGPLGIKGLLRPEDARIALETGASTIILSNHGGRQLDAAVAPLDMLAATRDLLGNAGEIILDGGIRRGTDLMKALALGANAGMAGRPGLYGLAAAGPAGVTRAFTLLRTEFERDLALLGVARAQDVDGACVTRVVHGRA